MSKRSKGGIKQVYNVYFKDKTFLNNCWSTADRRGFARLVFRSVSKMIIFFCFAWVLNWFRIDVNRFCRDVNQILTRRLANEFTNFTAQTKPNVIVDIVSS